MANNRPKGRMLEGGRESDTLNSTEEVHVMWMEGRQGQGTNRSWRGYICYTQRWENKWK